MTEQFPVLYILMRKDLKSMNPGKAMAQASHAANAFIHDAEVNHTKHAGWHEVCDWKEQTPQGFGTVLVLAVTEIEMRTAVEFAGLTDLISGIVHDPSYPVLIPRELGTYITDNIFGDPDYNIAGGGLAIGEGGGYATIPVDTCAYIFGNKNDPMLKAIVQNFPLHP